MIYSSDEITFIGIYDIERNYMHILNIFIMHHHKLNIYINYIVIFLSAFIILLMLSLCKAAKKGDEIIFKNK